MTTTTTTLSSQTWGPSGLFCPYTLGILKRDNDDGSASRIISPICLAKSNMKDISLQISFLFLTEGLLLDPNMLRAE